MGSRGCIAREHAVGIPNLRPPFAKCHLRFIKLLVLGEAIEVFLAEKPREVYHAGAFDPLDGVLAISAPFIGGIKCDYGRDSIHDGVDLSVATSRRDPEYETLHETWISNTHSIPWNAPRGGPATA